VYVSLTGAEEALLDEESATTALPPVTHTVIGPDHSFIRSQASPGRRSQAQISKLSGAANRRARVQLRGLGSAVEMSCSVCGVDCDE